MEYPSRGMVSPLDFIPLAEETGLIIPVGKWVLHTACKQTKTWHEQVLTPLVISVNISVRQFKDKFFIENLKQVLEDTELDPKNLELEVTESVMQNVEDSMKVLNEIKKLG